MGSMFFVVKGVRFFREQKGTIFSKLVLPTVLGWLITMYILGITATFYMLDEPRRGTLVVLPIFIIWFITFIILTSVINRWSKEALRIKNFYENLEKEINLRAKDLSELNLIREKQIQELSLARKREEEQVRELDKIAKRLVRRDFELWQVNERLREMDQAKSHFVSLAAHQLRTPLSGIKWTMQMMLDGDFGHLSKGQQQALVKANDSLTRLVGLIGSLLDVARIEEGRYELNFTEVRLEDVCHKVWEENTRIAKERGLSFNLILPKERLPLISGDFSNLVLALQNIVENAISYTKNGGVVDITLGKDPKDSSRVRISVKDTGMGISESQKQFVGQKFFRGDNVVKEQIQGTGLGLYIASRIIEKHGGKLEFESTENKGSIFYFSLPFIKKI